MDHHRWPQGLGFSAAAIKSSASESSCISNPAAGERRARPNKERVLNCPRCNSGNTKFCYYNNYSLTQPRYFCKTCRRYWTEGGSLRNVPVGGGSRKNKRSSAAKAATPSSSASASAARSKYYGVQDLNLIGNGIPEDAYPNLELINGCSNGATAAVEILTGTGMTGGARLMPVTEYSPASFGTLQEEFRPAAALNFALDGGDRHQFDPAEQHKAAAHRGEPSLPPPPGFWNGLVHGGDGSW